MGGKTKLFSLLPARLQTTMKRLVDSRLVHHSQVQVKYSDINDKKFPETLKKMLFNFCLRKEKDKKKMLKEEERKMIRQELLEMKQMLANLTASHNRVGCNA